MMSPKVLEGDGLIIWFHSYDALHENRGSVHAGKGSQDDLKEWHSYRSKAMDEKLQVKRYKVQHPIDEYTFPTNAHIHDVRVDEKYMHVELTDQRIISIPLWWIPTVYNASEEDRKKFQISQSRTMIIWDPDKCGINDEISIADYLGPTLDSKRPTSDYSQKESQKQIAEAKTRKQ